jgi:hypothetical protein
MDLVDKINGKLNEGFMGLEDLVDSDNASDLMYNITLNVVKELEKNLKTKENKWNTSGPVNIGLIAKTGLFQILEKYNPSLIKGVLNKARKGINKEMENEKRPEFLRAYKKMLTAL